MSSNRLEPDSTAQHSAVRVVCSGTVFLDPVLKSISLLGDEELLAMRNSDLRTLVALCSQNLNYEIPLPQRATRERLIAAGYSARDLSRREVALIEG